MLRTIRRKPVTSIFAFILLFILSGAVWQELNRSRTPVVACNEQNDCIVWLGSILDQSRYEYRERTEGYYVLEYIYVPGGLPYRVVNNDIVSRATRAGWEHISELPPNIDRWYTAGRMALDDYRYKHKDLRNTIKENEMPPG